MGGPSESGDWPTFVGTLPDGDRVPDNALAVIDTAPLKDGRIMGSAPLFHHGIQVLLRSFSYNPGYSKTLALAVALAAVANTEVEVESGVTYVLNNVTQFSGVIPLGQEQETTKRRWMFSVNFLATIQEA